MSKTLGVVVGRFQVAELTEGHKKLIERALSKSNKVLLLLGTKPKDKTDTHNPLTYKMRYDMIAKEFENDLDKLIITPIKDQDCLPIWVQNVDLVIDFFSRQHDISNVVLFGGRDSFINGYIQNNGCYQNVELVNFDINEVSGTIQREQIAKEIINSVYFRKGVIYKTLNT